MNKLMLELRSVVHGPLSHNNCKCTHPKARYRMDESFIVYIASKLMIYHTSVDYICCVASLLEMDDCMTEFVLCYDVSDPSGTS